jgi:hypothetical protein
MIKDLQYKGWLAGTNAARKNGIARRKIFIIFYILILFVYLIRPVLPYLEYLIYKDYISKNLCIKKDIPDNNCHGLCHLADQLKKFGEPVDADRNDQKRIFQDKKVEDHLLSESAVNKPADEIILHKRLYSEQIFESFLTPLFVPPRFC